MGAAVKTTTRADTPPVPPGVRTGRERALAGMLADANRSVYLEKMRQTAQAFGARPPTDITDASVLAGIQERATVSARSIVNTQATVAARLINDLGSGAAAQPAYHEFLQRQADMVAQYETAMTASQAMQDFIANNDMLQGQEWVEPADAQCDECAEAVGLGLQPLGTLDPPPLHPNCQHALATDFAALDDPSGLWFGQSDGEGD